MTTHDHMTPPPAGTLAPCGGPALCPTCVHVAYAPLVAAACAVLYALDDGVPLPVLGDQLSALRQALQDVRPASTPPALQSCGPLCPCPWLHEPPRAWDATQQQALATEARGHRI